MEESRPCGTRNALVPEMEDYRGDTLLVKESTFRDGIEAAMSTE